MCDGKGIIFDEMQRKLHKKKHFENFKVLFRLTTNIKLIKRLIYIGFTAVIINITDETPNVLLIGF
jgi:hypothetical protein